MKPLFFFLFLLLGIQSLHAEAVKASVTTDTGMVEYTLPGSADYKQLKFKEVVNLPEGSTIRTGKEGVAIISPFPGAVLKLAPQSSMTLGSMDVKSDSQAQKITSRQGLVELGEGTIKAVLKKQEASASPIDFKVKTPHGVAAARGTKYTVTTIGNKTYIKVSEGTVNAIDNNGHALDVTSTTTGIAVLGADGTVTVVPFSNLPADVQSAINSNTTYIQNSDTKTTISNKKTDNDSKNGNNDSGGGGRYQR